MNLLLADFGERKVLLDTGVGNKNLRQLRSYGFHSLQNISDAVRILGVSPEEITDVVLSHLHFDHCGGCTYLDENGSLQLTFQNATHWVSRRQYEHALSPTLLDSDSYLSESIEPIVARGRMKFIDHDQAIFNHFRLTLYDGHTPGQIVSVFILDGQTYCYAGDVVPTAAHLSPTWFSPYDLYPVEAVSEKIRLLDQASSEDWNLVTYHDVYHPVVRVKKIGTSFKKLEVK